MAWVVRGVARPFGEWSDHQGHGHTTKDMAMSRVGTVRGVAIAVRVGLNYWGCGQAARGVVISKA